MQSFLAFLRRLVVPLLGTFVIAFSFVAGVYARDIIPPVAAAVEITFAPIGLGSPAPKDVDLDALWKVWNALDEKFVSAGTSTEPVSEEDKVWGMIQGLAASYGDPYTVFLPPAENEVFQGDVSGSFGGVGMEIGTRDNVLTVIAPLKDTPAARAGVIAGDKVILIDGESTEGLSVGEAVSRIRGEVGTSVKITFIRDDGKGPFELTLQRETITVPTLEAHMRTDGVFVIQLSNFSANAPQAFRDALRQFSASGSKRLILDLRNNPGGYLEAATDIASWFLPAGAIVVTEDYGDKRDSQHHRSYGYDIFAGKDLKMVVLINGGSASASEILAGALSQNNVATLMGQKSFGKGSVQELVPITAETALKVTVAQWLTPDGTSISKAGLKPEIEVVRTPEDLEKGLDPQMEKAAEYLIAH